MDLVESGEAQAKLEYLEYVVDGFASASGPALCSSARELVAACADKANRCVLRVCGIVCVRLCVDVCVDVCVRSRAEYALE